MQYLPTHGFEWVEIVTEYSDFWTEFVLKQEDEQEDGYMFEVDLGYSEELHDSHDNFTLTLRRICSAHTRNNWQMT